MYYLANTVELPQSSMICLLEHWALESAAGLTIHQMPDGPGRKARSILVTTSEPGCGLPLDSSQWWVCSALSSACWLIRGKWPYDGESEPGPPSLIITLRSGYVRLCSVTWYDVRHTLILTTSASDPGPGKFYTNEKMLRIFLKCRPVGR